MVEWHDGPAGGKTIVLRPNGSLNRRQALALLGFCALLMGTVAAVSALLGGWLALPFSGLEWLLLAYCLRLSLRRSAEREVITIADAVVRIETGRHRPEQAHVFQRTWLAVSWKPSPGGAVPGRLSLRLHGKEVEIGRFLLEAERSDLARQLSKLLAPR